MTDTRTKILDAAEELVQSVGVNAMSYKHLSEAVGIRKASVHHHFPKKDDLVDALLHRCQGSYGLQYEEIIAGALPAQEKLRALAGVFEEGLLNNRLCVIGSISTDKNTLQERNCKILENNIKTTVDLFAKVFSQGREEGTLTYEGNEKEAAYAFLSYCIGAQIVARAQGGVDHFEKATELLIRGLQQ
jgi:TetR/AcrR family transcriptional repressor of nem operon